MEANEQGLPESPDVIQTIARYYRDYSPMREN
jgi:hypothetical protein